MRFPRTVFVIGLEAPEPRGLRRTRRWARARVRSTYPLGLGVYIDNRGREASGEAQQSAPPVLEAEIAPRPTGTAPTSPAPGIA